MTSPADGDTPLAWIPFLDERLHAAVRAVTGAEDTAYDPLRGLYISDEQALNLAGHRGPADADARLARGDRAARARRAASRRTRGVHCTRAAPRYGRLYAYLQDDITRRLASPRLVAAVLCRPGGRARRMCSAAWPMRRGCRGWARCARSRPTRRAVRRPSASRWPTGSRRSCSGLGRSGPRPGRPRRCAGCWPRPTAAGARTPSPRYRHCWRPRTPLPLLVVGPDAGEVLAAALGAPLLLVDARDLEQAETFADATLAAALEHAHVCLDGLEDLAPPQRARLWAHLGAPERDGAADRPRRSRHPGARGPHGD